MGSSINPVYDVDQSVRHRGVVLGVLLIAIIVVEAPKDFAFFLSGYRGYGGWVLLSYSLMVAFPFFLARIAPTVAGFDKQWLPSARLHWLWFVGMVFLLLAVQELARWLMSFHGDWFLRNVMSQIMRHDKPAIVVFSGVFTVLLGPIAEEIFWRGYVLEQLRKLTHWSVAILIQSSLFTLGHVSRFWPSLPYIFVIATIFGIWRIRFRSLLPIVLAHVIINGVVLIPNLKTQYDASVKSYSKCQEIDSLTSGPVEKAVPAIIRFAADPDEVVSVHALSALMSKYQSKAEPYLKVALASSDKRTVDRALFAIEMCGYAGLKPQVRKIAWSFDDRKIQLAATMALRRLEDQEGLQNIAQGHPDETIRRVARQFLGEIRGRKRDRSDNGKMDKK